MKILSFSLWGNDPIYNIGAIKNAKLAKEIYKDFECRFYVPTNYNSYIKNQLLENDAKVIEKSSLKGHLGSMWRFIPCFENDVDIVVSRDTDSRLTHREYDIVIKFLHNDNYSIQTLKDHECHRTPEMLAGMTAFKPKEMYKNFSIDYYNFIRKDYKKQYPEYSIYGGDYKGCDQIFLSKFVYPKMKDKIITYSDLTNNPIGMLLDRRLFIGNKFDENDNVFYIRGY